MLPKIHEKAMSVPLPENLRDDISDMLQDEPEIPWDQALANIVNEAGWAAE